MYKCKKCDFVAKTEVGLRKHENRKIPCDAKKIKGKQKEEDKKEEDKKEEDKKEDYCKECPTEEKNNIEDDDDLDEKLGLMFFDECDKLFKMTRDTHFEYFKKLEDEYIAMDKYKEFMSMINAIISLSNQGIWFMCRCQVVHRVAVEKHAELDEKEVRKLLIKIMFKNEIEGILNELIGSNCFNLQQLSSEQQQLSENQ